MTNIRFIQFPHPGKEHRPNAEEGGKPWNPIRRPNGKENSHARTFFQVNGIRLTEAGKVTGPLWAWGEWEAEAKAIGRFDAEDGKPATLFEPYWVSRESFENLHNTDPFIFDGFYYTDCKQGTSPALKGMLNLEVGTVIIFGSASGRDHWVLDTVFVVGKHIDHNVLDYQKLRDYVPAGYEQVVLGPTYREHGDRRDLPRRLYIGATFNNPFEGMFSFFPCSAPGGHTGFARPEIRLSTVLTKEYFNPNLAQGMKGQSRRATALSLTRVQSLWKEIHDQVKATGLKLGIWAEMPQTRGGGRSV